MNETTPSFSESTAGPDVSDIVGNDWPFRPIALAAGHRDRRYQAVVRPAVLDAIHGHGKSCKSVEVCGVLVGNVFQDETGPYLHVNSSIRGDRASGSAAQVTFTAETWSAIQKIMDENHPDERIVGWYHTHPGFGIFLSGMDLFIQDHFFNLPWQVAFVYDPIGGDEGMFFWKNGKADRQTFLIENDGIAARSPTEMTMARAELEARDGTAALDPREPPAAVFVVDPSPTPLPLPAGLTPPPGGSPGDGSWGDRWPGDGSPGDGSAGRWSGTRAAVIKKPRIPIWFLGALAFVVSFACTLWALYANRDVIIVRPHVEKSATPLVTPHPVSPAS